MAELVKIEDNVQGYHQILETVLTKGRKQASRNGDTIEIEDLVIELADPRLAVIGSARPGYNVAIGAVEALQLIAGVSDSSLTCEIQPNFRNFMDDGEFWGAYGPRAVKQLPVIAQRLRADPDTRQAVITLWNPEFDAVGGKRDHPCTTAFNFRIRDGKLNMTTFMRSNDAWWGWPYDAFQFCALQLSMANVLCVEPGTYTHHAASFHLYQPHWQAAAALVDSDVEPQTQMKLEGFGSGAPRLSFLGDRASTEPWESARDEARDVWHVVRGVKDASVLSTETQRWYANTLMSRKIAVANNNLIKLENTLL